MALGSAAVAPGPAEAQPTVTGVRTGDFDAATRFVLDVTEQVDFQVFTLPDPYRVVIDLSEVSWQLPQSPITLGSGLIGGFRYGLFQPGQSRVVLDVSAPVTVRNAFVLTPEGSYKYRLVLDLEPVEAADFRRQGTPPSPPASQLAMVPAPPPAAVDRPARRPDAHRVVVVDPGHGGIDPGTIGRMGTREKDIALAMARELRRQLEATGRYRVVLTRDDDIFISLRDRVGIARAKDADLFISIHADAHRDPTVRGASVYTLSETASDAEAAALAAKENKADVIAGIDLSHHRADVASILIDLAQRETMNQSAQFASVLVRELGNDVRLLRQTHRFAGFAVLRAPDVPSVLVELGYLSNAEEERLLRDPAHRARLAAALVRATDRYFREGE